MRIYQERGCLIVEWPEVGFPSIEYEEDGSLSVYMHFNWVVNRGVVFGSNVSVRWRD